MAAGNPPIMRLISAMALWGFSLGGSSSALCRRCDTPSGSTSISITPVGSAVKRSIFCIPVVTRNDLSSIRVTALLSSTL